MSTVTERIVELAVWALMCSFARLIGWVNEMNNLRVSTDLDRVPPVV